MSEIIEVLPAGVSISDLIDEIALMPPAMRMEALSLLNTVVPKKTAEAELLESQGHRTWRHAVFPRHFNKPDSWFQGRFWDKTWEIEKDVAPPPLLLPWFRDGGKSMCIRTAGLQLAARGLRRYILYFSGTQDQSDKHVLNISRMLKSSGIALYYPDMSTAQLSDVTGARVSWNRKRIVTNSGLVIDSLGLETASRGINFDELRPDIIFIDDIDKFNDSHITVMVKIAMLAGSIFPTGQDNTWICFAQNVIHGGSVMNKCIDGSAGILLNAEQIGPVPAMKKYSYDRKIGRNGKMQYKITSGVSNWPEGFGLGRAEKELNASGLEFFEREFQHNTQIAVPGALYPGFSALHHLCTWEEIAIAFESKGVNFRLGDGYAVPYHFFKGNSLDYGTSLEHPSALKWITVPGEYDPFNDIWLWYRERTLPKYPHQTGETVEPVSPILLAKVIREAEAAAREGDNMATRVMSHEQSAAMLTFNENEKMFARQAYNLDPEQVDFANFDGLDFKKRKGDSRSGIAQMQDRFFIDESKPHPFRRYPAGYQVSDEYGKMVDVGGRQVMGRPYQVFIVANNQGALFVDGEGQLCIQGPVDDDGMIRSRSERPRYRNRSSQDGHEQNKPVDIFQDQMDAERYLAEDFAVEVAPASRDQRIDRLVKEKNPDLAFDEIKGYANQDQRAKMAARQRLLEIAEAEVDALEGNQSYGNPLMDRLEKMRQAQ